MAGANVFEPPLDFGDLQRIHGGSFVKGHRPFFRRPCAAASLLQEFTARKRWRPRKA
jgi:hypothetical protein